MKSKLDRVIKFTKEICKMHRIKYMPCMLEELETIINNPGKLCYEERQYILNHIEKIVASFSEGINGLF